jgi:hypothetical protein
VFHAIYKQYELIAITQPSTNKLPTRGKTKQAHEQASTYLCHVPIHARPFTVHTFIMKLMAGLRLGSPSV